MIGNTLDHYRIEAKLGAGGMGVVYKARDTHLDRLVAIKVLPPHKIADTGPKQRFIQEARAASALNHPNIVTIHDIRSRHGVDFIVMEYIEGKTLKELVPAKGIRPTQALKYAVQIADALAKAHSAGILHRDLKPSNVMVSDEGRVKILDFGLAKLIEPAEFSGDATTLTAGRQLTEEGAVMGTAAYMSPEQAEGRKVDARSDIFSFGTVLYEMVSGRKPFAGDSWLAMLAKILNEDPTPPGQLTASVPPGLEKLILRCLRKDPARRFQTMADLKVALEDVEEESASGRQVKPSASRRRAIDSLAVLPFVNVGADPNTEYLSDGITEHLINYLSQLPKLRVTARTLAFRYKGSQVDPQKAGHKLRVRAVLTGRVLERGGALNIQADLMNVDDGSQIWGHQYNRRFSDILSVQEEIAREVSGKLRLKPTAEQQKLLANRSTENTEAYQAYLKGRYYWNRRSGEMLKRAVEYFQQAIDKDPGYVLAHAGLADCYAVYSAYEVEPPRESGIKAKVAATKALEIDNTLAEAHASLAITRMNYEWDWAGAEQEFQRAMDLDLNYPTAHEWYGLYLAAIGRTEQAVASLRRAQQLDPLSLVINSAVGWTLYFACRYDEAIEQIRKTLEMDPNFGAGHWALGLSYEQKAMYREAIAEFQFARGSRMLGALGHAYALSGDREKARRTLVDLYELSKRRYVSPFSTALIYTGLFDKESALEWLEKAAEGPAQEMIWLKVDPRFDRLRTELRFTNLLRRMNLEP